MPETIPDIDSFVIRFVRSSPEQSAPGYRGTVRHVQSNQERPFKDWEEVVAFIRQFVKIED